MEDSPAWERKRMDMNTIREKYMWEKILFGKLQAQYRKQIRKRKSYKMWERIWMELTNKRPEEVLVLIWEEMNRARVFGTASNAQYAKESLELFLEDSGKKNK